MKVKSKVLNEAEKTVFKEIAFGLSIPLYLKSLGFSIFEWQEKVLWDRSPRIVINGARQSGKSTIISAKACHRAKYKPGSLTIVLAPTQKQSWEDMEKINSFLSQDRNFPKVLHNNKEELKLANGSRILVLTASDDAARGFSNPDLVIFDEASRIDDSVFNAVRPMMTNNLKSQMVEISTPNGKKGFFYRHFNTTSWSRYNIVSSFVPSHDELGYPTLIDVTNEDNVTEDGINYFVSPRHKNFQEQLSAFEEFQWDERQYRQEYCTEFVDSEDQVFSQETLDTLFGERSTPVTIKAQNLKYDQFEDANLKALLNDLGGAF